VASPLGGSVAGCVGCAARDAVIAAQGRANAALAGRVAKLEAADAQLLARVERLERLVSRNSGNSSFPPSMDDQPGRTPPRKPRRARGKRKPGGQPGSPGTHLAWSDVPDETIPHFPDGTCACGAALSGAADLGVVASHQQVEIPLASATVTQHDLHAVACGCGKVHQAARPEGMTGSSG
jgi:transposase